VKCKWALLYIERWLKAPPDVLIGAIRRFDLLQQLSAPPYGPRLDAIGHFAEGV
jgi:hypothetical protein